MPRMKWYFLTAVLTVTSVAPQAGAIDLFAKKQKEQAPVADKTKLVAEVNGAPITREQLANELIEAYGEKQLELMIHRQVIAQACKDRGIEVTPQELNDEIASTLKTLNVRPQEFRDNILARRGITYNQYVRDTVWPALALKKLVDGKIEVKEEEIQKSFIANYGDKVDVRMLVVREQRKAFELWESFNAIEDKEQRLTMFEESCKTYSVDAATRPYGGKAIIHHHTNAPDVEKLAFALEPGDLSKIIQVREGNLMLLCVDRVPASEVVTLETVANEKTEETIRDLIVKDLMEKKTRMEIANVFEELSKKTPIKNFLTGDFDIDDVGQPNAN